MNEKKTGPSLQDLLAKPDEAISGQGTSPEEQGLFECHPEAGENCDGRPDPEPLVDAAHPRIVKVEAQHPGRAKDERALFDCDANGKNCDS